MSIPSIPSLEVPPSLPQSYTIPSLCGEIIYIPCSKSATRLLVTGKETDNAFAIVGSGGTQSSPIGFHFHREAHDVFLCLKGSVNVWAGDQCRTLTSGDFASVPPGVIHQYQILGPYTEFIGLIVPGGWEEFFRFIGEPYSGPLFPLTDNRNPFEVLIPKLKMAAEKFDMVPCPQHQGSDPQPWNDTKLPGKLEPYFLKNGTGPKYLVGGTIIRPLCTTSESNDRFSVFSIEGSSMHKPILENKIKFMVHHCFQVSDGLVEFSVDDRVSTLSAGETVYIPAGSGFNFHFKSRFAKVYLFSNGGGLGETFLKLGTLYEQDIVPEKENDWSEDRLRSIQDTHGFSI